MNEVVNEMVMEFFIKNPIFWTFIILAVVGTIFYKKIIGAAGEHWVNKELKKLPLDYKCIHNLLIKTKDNKTHQIDHVIVSPYGIFVIETKQWNGYIVGTDYDKKWTIKSGNKTFSVYNPVHQNYGHIKSLEELLKLDNNKFISIVCISSRAKCKIKSKVVCGVGNLLDKIKVNKDIVINNADKIYNKLLSLNIDSHNNRKEHTKDIKK